MTISPSLFLRDDLLPLQPYHVEPYPHLIKLDANESPFDVPAEIKAEIAEAFARLPLNRYPDSAARTLRERIAERLGVPVEWVGVGNGSDELIACLIQALARPDARVIAPEPTFSMYRLLAQVAGVSFQGVPLVLRKGARPCALTTRALTTRALTTRAHEIASFELDAEGLEAQIRPEGTHLFFFSYPNNPTGNCWGADVIANLLRHRNVLVVADEAYFEFSGKTFLPLVKDFANLIVLRTFSKAYGLAGLRVGVMIASPEWVEFVNKARLPYNVNAFSQLAATVLLKHADIVQAHIARILAERQRLLSAFVSDPRFEPFATDANFVLFRAHEGAEQVFRLLLDHWILIRNLSRAGLLENCLRVTVGTPDENAAVLAALGIP